MATASQRLCGLLKTFYSWCRVSMMLLWWRNRERRATWTAAKWLSLFQFLGSFIDLPKDSVSLSHRLSVSLFLCLRGDILLH